MIVAVDLRQASPPAFAPIHVGLARPALGPREALLAHRSRWCRRRRRSGYTAARSRVPRIAFARPVPTPASAIIAAVDLSQAARLTIHPVGFSFAVTVLQAVPFVASLRKNWALLEHEQ